MSFKRLGGILRTFYIFQEYKVSGFVTADTYSKHCVRVVRCHILYDNAHHRVEIAGQSYDNAGLKTIIRIWPCYKWRSSCNHQYHLCFE